MSSKKLKSGLKKKVSTGMVNAKRSKTAQCISSETTRTVNAA